MSKHPEAFVNVSFRPTLRDRVEARLLGAALSLGLPQRFADRWAHRVIDRPGRVVVGPLSFRE